MKEKYIDAYLRNRLTVGEETLKQIVKDSRGRPLAKRSVFLRLEKYLREFSYGSVEPRWLAVPGLRGVGKTTLIAQLYNQIKCHQNCKIYITLDDAKKNLGISLQEILNGYEEILGEKFERLSKNVYLFLDEVQYDETWAVTLKSLYDRTKKVFILCTGSSALELQTSPDSSRRLHFTKIYPLSFIEYRLVKYRHTPIPGLGRQIRDAIFTSNHASEVYQRLVALQSLVDSYWNRIQDQSLQEYLKFGTLPSALAIGRESLIFPNINQTLNSVLNKDVPQMNRFDRQTIEKLSQVLYAVASSEVVSYNKISETLGMDYKVVQSVFDALNKAELLIKVLPRGSHQSQVRKPAKFLFASPAFRAMYFNLVGSTYTYNEYKGKLFEDIVGMYLFRIFDGLPDGSLTYDFSQGGADFIVGIGGDNIIIEASLGRKGMSQIQVTRNNTDAKYGLVVSQSPLRVDPTNFAVAIPYKYFLLI